MNYFEVLGLSIEELQGQDEATIKKIVDKAHSEHYAKTVGSYANIPRSDGRNNAQWQAILIEAKEVLQDPQKRRTHIAELGGQEEEDPSKSKSKSKSKSDSSQSRPIIKFSNGDEATSIAELAKLIDQNWAEAKTLLFDGSIAHWLEYVGQQESAETAKRAASRYSEAKEQDIGLELLVQRLDPTIGTPDPKTSHTNINFGKIDKGARETVQLKIENAGRGYLYGDVQLASAMPGLRVSATEIRGSAVVTVELRASALTVKQTHKAELAIKTNGRTLTVPISCYVDYSTEKAIRRVVVSAISMAAIALVARLIVVRLGCFEFSWLTSAMFVDLSGNWVRWFKWPMIEVQLYTPIFACLNFIIGFAALGIGLFFFWQKRGFG